jgi:hypothetical protein
MPWAGLDDLFYDDPRTIEVGNLAAGVYARALSYCCRHLTDGKLPAKVLAGIVGDDDPTVIDRLVSARFLRRKGDGFELVDFLNWNPTRESVLRRREQKRQAGQKGASRRWRSDGESPIGD